MEITQLLERYPVLSVCEKEIEYAARELKTCFSAGGRFYVCGNGGSAADAGHIVGELGKGFLKKRPLGYQLCYDLKKVDPTLGETLSQKLQLGLPAYNLCENSPLSTAVANDLGGDLIYAQQVMAYGRSGDVLLAISTSGNALNLRYAAVTARALGMSVIGLTGQSGGKLKPLADVCICVPETETYKVQELHLPVYHYLCAAVEAAFYAE